MQLAPSETVDKCLVVRKEMSQLRPEKSDQVVLRGNFALGDPQAAVALAKDTAKSLPRRDSVPIWEPSYKIWTVSRRTRPWE